MKCAHAMLNLPLHVFYKLWNWQFTLTILLWEFIGVIHLPFEGRLMEEYIPFNAHFETLSTMCRRLFKIFFEFDDINVSYGN